MKHPFVDSGEVKIDIKGRRLKICATCQHPKIGTGHLPPVEEPTQILLQGDPWELEMLKHSISMVLDLPADAIGWRLRLRILDVQRAFSEGYNDLPLQRDPVIEEPVPIRGAPPSRTTIPSHRASARKILKGLPDAWKDLAETAINQGWEAKRIGSHLKFTHLSATVVIPSTPGEGRAYQNARALFKRSGLDV